MASRLVNTLLSLMLYVRVKAWNEKSFAVHVVFVYARTMSRHDKVFPLHIEQCWRYRSSMGHLSAMWKLRSQHSSLVGFLAIRLPRSGIKDIIIPSWVFQGLSLGVDDNKANRKSGNGPTNISWEC